MEKAALVNQTKSRFIPCPHEEVRFGNNTEAQAQVGKREIVEKVDKRAEQ